MWVYIFKVCLVSFVQLGPDVGKEALDGLCQLWPDLDPGTWDMIQQLTDLLRQSHMTPCICFHPIYSVPYSSICAYSTPSLLHHPSSSSSFSYLLLHLFVYSLKALPLLLLLQCFFLLPNSHPPLSKSSFEILLLLLFLIPSRFSVLLYLALLHHIPFSPLLTRLSKGIHKMSLSTECFTPWFRYMSQYFKLISTGTSVLD